MAKNTTPYIMENPINLYYKPRNKEHKHNSGSDRARRGISSLAFVLSLLSYACVFYVFNVSPRDLLGDSKFLFFLSNTLILIIAADYGAFASSKESAFESYRKVLPRINTETVVKQEEFTTADTDAGTITEELPADTGVLKEEESTMDASQSGEINMSNDSVNAEICEEVGGHTCQHEEEPTANDNDDERVAAEKEEREENDEFSRISDDEQVAVEKEEEEENDEFSRMSNEELNKRVEEFISKLKTQIRQQGEHGDLVICY